MWAAKHLDFQMTTQMTAKQLEAIKATFPWRTEVVQTHAIGGLVKLIDRNGDEVPIFDMTGFLEVVTQKMARNLASDSEQQKE